MKVMHFFLSLIFTMLMINPINGFELRAIVFDLDQVKHNIEALGAIFQSEYRFTDHIYLPQDNKDSYYGRIRIYEKSAWIHKPIVTTLKSTTRDLIHKHEYDTLHEAQNSLKKYDIPFAFAFSRTGWEYRLNNSALFLEKIDNGSVSLEIVGPEEEVMQLFKATNLDRFMDRPLPLYLAQSAINE